MTTKNVGGFFGDRSTSNAAASGFGAVTVGPFRGIQRHGTGVARLPRSRAVRPLLPRPVRPRLHHRQPRSRCRRPACSSTSRRDTRWRRRSWPSTSTSTASTTSSSGIRRRPISSSSGTGAGHACAASRSKRARSSGGATRWNSRAQVARGPRARRQRDTSTTSRRPPSPCSAARSLAIACMRRRASLSTRATIGRGRRRLPRPGATLLDVGAGWRLLPAARAARPAPQSARR